MDNPLGRKNHQRIKDDLEKVEGILISILLVTTFILFFPKNKRVCIYISLLSHKHQ